MSENETLKPTDVRALVDEAREALKNPSKYDPNGWTAPTCGLINRLAAALEAREWCFAMEKAPRDKFLEMFSQYGGDLSIVKWDESCGWLCYADGHMAIESQSDFGTEYQYVDTPLCWRVAPAAPTPEPAGEGEKR